MSQPLLEERFSRHGLMLFAALALGWGLNWPIMKMVLTALPPLYFRAFCMFFGGMGILLLARRVGSVRVPHGAWRRVLILALFNTLIWNLCIVYGLLLLPSGRAALLGYTMPVWSILFSVCLLGEALTRRRVIALLLGVLGMFSLMGDGLGNLLHAPLGVLLMLGAACSWAMGIVLLKRLPTGMTTSALTAWMLILSSIPMLLVAIPLETNRLAMPGFWPLFGVVYNVFVVFMFGQWAWNRIVLMVPVAVSSLSALIIPLIGVLGGALILGEQPGWREGLAALLIFAAVAVMHIKRSN